MLNFMKLAKFLFQGLQPNKIVLNSVVLFPNVKSPQNVVRNVIPTANLFILTSASFFFASKLLVSKSNQILYPKKVRYIYYF